MTHFGFHPLWLGQYCSSSSLVSCFPTVLRQVSNKWCNCVWSISNKPLIYNKTCLLFLAESADEDIPDAMFKESCITEQTQYFFDNDERSYSGVLDCGNCSRYVGVSLCYCLCTFFYMCPHFSGSLLSNYKWVALLDIFSLLLYLLPAHPSV